MVVRGDRPAFYQSGNFGDCGDIPGQRVYTKGVRKIPEAAFIVKKIGPAFFD